MLRVSIVLSITAIAGCGPRSAAEVPPPHQPGTPCPAPVAAGAVGEVVELATGNFHACARLRSGAIRCWGMNSDGQLGDGTLDNRHRPVAPTQLRDVVAIAAGGRESCAIVEGGAVWCWGHDISALFGAAEQVRIPTEIPELAGASQIVLPFGHWCARFADGTARCSGDPGSGGTPEGGLIGVAAIAGGYAFSCALGDDRRVRCWGWNGDGRLGGATDAERALAPVEVPGLGPVEQIAAGFGTACARRADGTVWCWGSSSYGLLGDGTAHDTSRAAPAAVPGIECAVDLTMADHTACVRTADGRTHCWGEDTGGDESPLLTTCKERGTVDTSGCFDDICEEGEPEVYCARPTTLDLVGITQVAIGRLDLCVLVDGEARCWGSNFYGGIGDGTDVDRAEPTRVRLP